jgi:hypothetical protein
MKKMFKKLFGKNVEPTTSLERAYFRAMDKIYEAKFNKENEVHITHLSNDIDELIKLLKTNYVMNTAYRFGLHTIVVVL